MVVAPITTCVGVAVSELEEDDAGALNPWDEVWWRMLSCAIPGPFAAPSFVQRLRFSESSASWLQAACVGAAGWA